MRGAWMVGNHFIASLELVVVEEDPALLHADAEASIRRCVCFCVCFCVDFNGRKNVVSLDGGLGQGEGRRLGLCSEPGR